jgi:hypothetical protein
MPSSWWLFQLLAARMSLSYQIDIFQVSSQTAAQRRKFPRLQNGL